MGWTSGRCAVAGVLVIATGTLARPAAAQRLVDSPEALVLGTAGAGETSVLEVEVTGVEPPVGTLRLALFAVGSPFPDEPLRAALIPVEGEAVRWTVRLSPGVYALAAVHDRNRNGELDTGLFGIPREPYGFSNDARGRLGPPSFEDASFMIDAPFVRVPVRVR